MPTAADIAHDLADEQGSLDSIVATLSDEQWALATPSAGWNVADQIGHLRYFDGAATTAITDVEAFLADRDNFIRAATSSATAADELTLSETRAMDPAQLLDYWREGRRRLHEAASTLTDDTRIEWYGPSMGSKSFLTARLMEAWAHGQDIVDTVGAVREPTDRLRHIAQLGVITRAWSWVNRGLTPPAGEVRVELTAPSGADWQWGEDGAIDRVRGPARDFCLVVTQRRHVDDTGLTVEGKLARDWLVQAQAFAGPATDGPSAGRFT
jgi:uncharacterized protein (TIGR03084 family)